MVELTARFRFRLISSYRMCYYTHIIVAVPVGETIDLWLCVTVACETHDRTLDAPFYIRRNCCEFMLELKSCGDNKGVPKRTLLHRLSDTCDTELKLVSHERTTPSALGPGTGKASTTVWIQCLTTWHVSRFSRGLRTLSHPM